jgi:hypothetical protein
MAIPKYVFLFFVVIYKQFLVQKSLFSLNTFSTDHTLATDSLLYTQNIFLNISRKN